MSTYRSTRAADVQAANDMDSARSLTCAASGCPNRWSVSSDGPGLCSAHAWADRRKWPEITEAQRWAETERSRYVGDRRTPVEPMTMDEKRAILAGLRTAVLDMRVNAGTKDWAHALKAREQAGDNLTPSQREMWRAAIGRGGEA